MRRRARSITSHSQTLRFLRPTKDHNSSSSSTSHRLRWALAERRGSRGGEGSAAFFYPFGNRHPGHPREPDDAALRVALTKQGIDLGVLGRFTHGRWHEQPLVAARGALVFGLAFFTAIAANCRAAALGAKMLRINHSPLYGAHPLIDHRQIYIFITMFLTKI